MRLLLPLLLVLMGTTGGAGAAGRADDVAGFLERHGLRDLLAVHLEQQLDALAGEAREQAILQLAGLYAELLASADDPARRQRLEERGRALLAMTPLGSLQRDQLHMELLRGSYRSAEATAENHRLRLVSEAELQETRQALKDLIPRLQRLAEQLAEHHEDQLRRLGRAGGSDSVLLSDHVTRLEQLQSQCTFLTAWALYYQAWLDDRTESARLAQQLFAELIDPEQPRPNPSEISVDLRANEAIARAILGIALCKSITASTASAIAWVELLEHPRTFAALREQAPAWRMAVFLEGGDYLSVQGELDPYIEEGREVPLAWLRLIAVHALEADRRNRQAASLVSYAVMELARREELDQVLDLATRYGVESLGRTGFALRYVSGVIKYREARKIHAEDRPAIDPEALSLYGEAARELRAALEAPDAAEYDGASASCLRLLAWCLYFQSGFLDAQEAFEAASEVVPAAEGPEALWMAIVCLEKVLEARRVPSLQSRQRELVERFLRLYPSSEHAPKLVLKRALAQEEISPEVVEQLLSIPETSEVAGVARSRAAQILYQLFRDASDEERVGFGNEYLGLAVPLLAEDERLAEAGDALARQRYITRCRRILDVALSEGVERLVAARDALAAFDDQMDRDPAGLADLVPEIDYRRIRERILSDDLDRAGVVADRLWEQDPDLIWSRLAARALFKEGYRRWKDAPTGEAVRRGEALVVEYGPRVLAEYDADPAALDSPALLGSYTAVADAAMSIWQRSGDPEMGRLALSLFGERLLPARPRSAHYLRATGLLREVFGPADEALQCWRSLVAGSAGGSDAWYEAKVHLITLLAESDPDRARAVLEQHRQLQPDLGPEPWRSQLRALSRRLAAAAAVAGDDDAEPEGDPPPETDP